MPDDELMGSRARRTSATSWFRRRRGRTPAAARPTGGPPEWRRAREIVSARKSTAPPKPEESAGQEGRGQESREEGVEEEGGQEGHEGQEIEEARQAQGRLEEVDRSSGSAGRRSGDSLNLLRQGRRIDRLRHVPVHARWRDSVRDRRSSRARSSRRSGDAARDASSRARSRRGEPVHLRHLHVEDREVERARLRSASASRPVDVH